MREFLVTVYCSTYNHEKYISKTLEGFVKQKTNFPFRVIIHDDASNDNTQRIITEFAKKYSNLFYVILQKENKYSRGIDIYSSFIEPQINSKYIAVCEGDDYWCDENKLQVQVDYLEKNSDCSLCVHNTLKINENGQSLDEYFSNIRFPERNISIQEIIEAEGAMLFHTSSFVYRSELRKKMPNVYREFSVGDYPLSIYMALNGSVHYISKVMSCYRVCSNGSWTLKKKYNKDFAISTHNKFINGLRNIDECTKYKYTKSFNKVIKRLEFSNVLLEKKIYKIFFDCEFLSILVNKLSSCNRKYIFNRIKELFFC